jgi:hypothetical protein
MDTSVRESSQNVIHLTMLINDQRMDIKYLMDQEAAQFGEETG